MNHTIISYADKVKYTNKMFLYGLGGSNPKGKIRAFDMTFISHKEVDLMQSRNIAVDFINGFLNHVNDNKSLEPFLENYPINVNNIQLSIGFEDTNSRFIKPPHIALITFVRGIIIYSIINDKYVFEDICRETYEEALEIVWAEYTAPN